MRNLYEKEKLEYMNRMLAYINVRGKDAQEGKQNITKARLLLYDRVWLLFIVC